MSDGAHEQHKTPAAKKPVKQPPVRPRTHAKPKSDAPSTVKRARAPSVVPEIPAASSGSASRRASPWRLGVLTGTLAVLVGGLAWFSDAPEMSRSEPAQVALAAPPPAPLDVLQPHVRQSIEQELRLAAIALDIRESQESLTRLWEDARSLAVTVGTLASGVDSLKSEVGAVRSGAVAALDRVEDRLDQIEVAAVPELVPLGDPTIREAKLLGDPQIAIEVAAIPDLIQLGSPALRQIAQASETVQPATTGGLPEVKALPQASVKVAFAKPVSKARAKAKKPIDGWHVHRVSDDLALVEGQGTHYEVRTGELLPDAGIVRSIKKRGETWVVLTSKGVITEPK
jgi:hypothetical protein